MKLPKVSIWEAFAKFVLLPPVRGAFSILFAVFWAIATGIFFVMPIGRQFKARSANLRYSDFTAANLSWSQFVDANLDWINAKGASINHASLPGISRGPLEEKDRGR